jgi:DNA end-binding protein Ku
MVQLASQLIQRQAGKYDPGDLEDRYETRLRAMIDAKLKGEGIDLEADVTPPRGTNVVDLMTVLKQSLAACRSERRRDEASDCRSFVATACIRGVCGLSNGQKRLLDR